MGNYTAGLSRGRHTVVKAHENRLVLAAKPGPALKTTTMAGAPSGAAVAAGTTQQAPATSPNHRPHQHVHRHHRCTMWFQHLQSNQQYFIVPQPLVGTFRALHLAPPPHRLDWLDRTRITGAGLKGSILASHLGFSGRSVEP